MAWTVPEYPRRKVDEAGFAYAHPNGRAEDRELALAVINNWRSSHSYPLNTFQMNLRRVARRVDDEPTVAQRIKRLPSIRHKLERFRGMKLSRMQDIGGCRAVVSSVEEVNALVDYYMVTSRIEHRLVREDPYIWHPKASGYRGSHLVYRHISRKRVSWNGLLIEIQLRSRLQHAWATAVETVGTFTQQALKSSWGEKDWLRFFALMGSAHAFREATPLVPDTPTDQRQLVKELKRYVRKLDVVARLTAYGEALELVGPALSEAKGHTFLLRLDVSERELSVWSYDNPTVAADQYSAIERAIEDEPGQDVVLVSVDRLASLRSAYPNYFLDTRAFVESVQEAIA
jgi:hypothetical protein